MTESPQSWLTFLECVWDLGNKRHIAKADYKGGPPPSLRNVRCANLRIASRPRLSSKAKPQSKRQAPQKQLLHQVLRTAGLKAQKGPKLKRKELGNTARATDIMDSVDGMPTQRLALQPASPNRQIGKGGQDYSTTADEKAKILRSCDGYHDKMDVLDHTP